MINRHLVNYREPAVYYAEASSYIDAMDYAEFMLDEGWCVLVAPFVTKTERVFMYNTNGVTSKWVDSPTEWGFVLHRFHSTNIL